MVGRGGTTQRLASALVGAALVLTVSGCAATSPSASLTGPTATPNPSSSASLSPVGPGRASWTATGSMIGSRQAHTATRLLDGKVLVAGGITGINNQELASAELYDPKTGQWTATAAMVRPRYGHTATLLRDGKVLVAGGGATTTSAELYDPGTGTWTVTGSMIKARNQFSATLLGDGTVLVAGGLVTFGKGGITVLDSAELYDPATGTWTVTETMVSPRQAHSATMLANGQVLVAGGGDGTLPSAELYDPDSGQWTATGNMIEARFLHTATLLPDGLVWVVGGANVSSTQVTNSTELYDPISGSWTATASVPAVGGLPQVGGQATLLPNGKVLFPGGVVSSSGDTFVSSAWLFDPGSGSWTATVGMIGARGGSTATLLLDGRVLAAGGGSSPSTLLASAELYDPGSGAQ